MKSVGLNTRLIIHNMKKPPGFYELSVSGAYVGLTCLICVILRKTIMKVFPEPSLPRLLLQEAIATAELCACCFELIIVADNYGVWMYAVFLFLLTIWWSYCWSEASACPYIHLEEVVQGYTDIRDAALKVWAELGGGLLAYRYIIFLWGLEVVSTHRRRAVKKCTADLQVPVLVGAAIECVATCLCRLASRTLSEMNPRFSTAIDAAIGTSLVVLAFDYSGGYFNPALATSLKFGCKGNTTSEHIIVYWVGACLGSLMSLFIYSHPLVISLIDRLKNKKTE